MRLFKRIVMLTVCGALLLGSGCSAPSKPVDTDDETTSGSASTGATSTDPGSSVPDVPSTVYSDGLYTQYFPAYDFSGNFSTFQVAATYNDGMRLNADSVMVYVSNLASMKSAFESWSSASDKYDIDMMMAINRDNNEWVPRNPERFSESIQMNRNGEYITHATTTDTYKSYYMVPTLDWTEYVLEVVTRAVTEYHPGTIVFEEPEMWHSSGYSEGFKKEWKAYYGSDWVDPVSSPEATYMSMRLKTYLFERILTAVCERIHSLSPETKVYVATHSTVSYNSWSITAGLNSYLALGVLDGVIGQTWSDTASSASQYRGVTNAFINGYIEYASYLDSVEDTDFFALSDPMADNAGFTEEYCQKLYRQTLTASLMHPEIDRLQLFPWPDRSFAKVSPNYRTIQCSIFSALDTIPGKAASVTAGTPGIYIGISDSLSWQLNSTARSFALLTTPLVLEGIPIKMKSFEHVTTPEDLKDVNLLVLSYDCQKPASDALNTAVAEWVRQGGTLLYIGGHDEYESIGGQWWDKQNTTPLADLVAKLDCGITVKPEVSFENITYLDGSSPRSSSGFAPFYAPLSYAFEGGTPVLFGDGHAIAVTAKAGEGNVLLCGIPSLYFAEQNQASVYENLVKQAVSLAGLEYVESPVMTVRRGDLVAAHSTKSGYSVKGTFINLFDTNLPVVTDPEIAKEDCLLLYHVSGVSPEVPTIVLSGGEIESLSETSESTVFTLSGPSTTLLSTRIFAPKGLYPQTIESDDSVYFAWDNDSSSLVVQSRPNATVTVTWSDEFRATDEYIDMHEVYIATNEKNLDTDYIYESTAAANSSLRFCDLDRYLIYKFDLGGKENFTLTLEIFQNYILECSEDLENWTVLADYRDISSEHITTGGNNVSITVDPVAQGINETLYIRLRNTDVTKGWGGAITGFTMRWTD